MRSSLLIKILLVAQVSRVKTATAYPSYALPEHRGLQETRVELIPKVIHFTYPTEQPAFDVNRAVTIWKKLNPEWEVRAYSDYDIREYVATHFAEYLQAFDGLSKPVEKADFWRYLVLLRDGGLYTDIDITCNKPLDTYILGNEGLVVGWERDGLSQQLCTTWRYPRQRQILQWIFASAPGHPALRRVCDLVAGHYNSSFSANENRNILERTGPAVFTDGIMSYVKQSLQTDESRSKMWPIVFLPIAYWGPKTPNAALHHHLQAATHHFKGRWKTGDAAAFGTCEPAGRSLFPVTLVRWTSAVTMMTHMGPGPESNPSTSTIGDVTLYGDWQPGLPTMATPSALAVMYFVMRLAGPGAPSAPKSVLKQGRMIRSATMPCENCNVSHSHHNSSSIFIDIGAGYGQSSLVFAGRGFRVVAFSRVSDSLDAFSSSIVYNKFEHVIALYPVMAAESKPCIGGKVTVHNRDITSQQEAGAWLVNRNCHSLTSAKSKVPLSAGHRVPVIRFTCSEWEFAILESMLSRLDKHHAPLMVMMVQPSEETGAHNETRLRATATKFLAQSGYSAILRAQGKPCESTVPGSIAHMLQKHLPRSRNGGLSIFWCDTDVRSVSTDDGGTPIAFFHKTYLRRMHPLQS